MNDYANLSKKEVLRHTGMIKQIAGVTRFKYVDGNARELSAVRVKNGGGLDFTVLEGRSLDIYELEFKGINLAFFYKNGLMSPERVLHTPNELLNQGVGGMMYTSGLINSGPENTTNDGLFHPLHGRIGTMSADNFSASAAYDDQEEFLLQVSGRMRESRVFMHNLTLTRKISTNMNSNSFVLEDIIENETPRESSFAILYHLNFGYPFIDKNVEVIVPAATSTEVRDNWSKAHLDNCFHMTAPEDSHPEHLYYHSLPADSNGICQIFIVNWKLELAVSLSYHKEQLPYMVEWKSIGSGDYVLAMMPSNSLLRGRKDELAAGGMAKIEAFEKAKTGYIFTVHEGLKNIKQKIAEIRAV